ncbi:zinc finger CCCH-type with G patch domain-containing protein [Venturia canescens]|uniref:zinc finger CCCH-type with G patch domain-containing protein n=1 Tax=Venturia canescens TaxID=32260 RepID=UPI001C9C9923|nr:zinc finger CCCH-type with G patch domain-containing protein [Venturia canescens]
MTDVESLQESINQYEKQLSQVKLALSATDQGPDRDNLLSLQSDIEELITLTAQSLRSAKGECTDSDSAENLSDDDDDPMAKEYALFKAELEQSSEDSEDKNHNEKAEASNDIEDELKALEGMKCRAPHGSSWGGTGYHNAMVSSIHRDENEIITSINDIKVRVLFVNPTHKEMLPCPYFLDGACKFSDEQCHYSHGEVVPLSNLQEYKEPVFSSLKMGSRVLAKQKNNLWHRCVILKMPEKENDDYRIKFESSGNITEVAVQDLLPLEDADLEMSDSSDDSESERETCETPAETLVHKSLLTLNSGDPLGSWEQHTRGIGSKLMEQMGYVRGTGLGKRADGRIAPVEATVLPAGKSLDHCMELREHAGGDKDLFTAERKMQKQRRKMEQQREKQYIREKAREKNNVFNFINTTLGDKPSNENEPGSSKGKSHYKSHTNRGLNVASFEISENITRLEKESSKLMNSLGRHAKGSLPYNNIVLQYNEKQSELAGLRSTQNHIATEQNQRKDKAKLSVF